MDKTKYKIYYHKDLGIYELRYKENDRWQSSVWEPTLCGCKYHAYRLQREIGLEMLDIFPNIPVTEGSAKLVWMGEELTGEVV